jgi:hypothetical protein
MGRLSLKDTARIITPAEIVAYVPPARRGIIRRRIDLFREGVTP